MVPRPLATAVIVVVCLVWVGNFVATVFVPGYVNDASINFVFATIVGGALTLRRPDNGSSSVMDRVGSALRALAPPAPPPPTPPAPPAEPERETRP